MQLYWEREKKTPTAVYGSTFAFELFIQMTFWVNSYKLAEHNRGLLIQSVDNFGCAFISQM